MGVSTSRHGWIPKSKSVLPRMFSSLPCLIFLLFLAPFSNISSLAVTTRPPTVSATPGKESSPLPNNSWWSHTFLGSLASASVIQRAGKFRVHPIDLWSIQHSLTLFARLACTSCLFHRNTVMDASRIHCRFRRFEASGEGLCDTT